MADPIVQGPIIQGPIIQGPIIQGWCPGALRPMESGDGWVVRVRPRNGEVSQAQARGIADFAELCGNGFVQLTNRGNLQIRGVTETTYPTLIDGLRGLGLIDSSVAAERTRNIVVSPFRSTARDDWFRDHAAMAEGLAQGLSDPDFPRLPGKFGFAIDAEVRIRHLAGISADIRIESAWDDLIVRADGAALGRRVTDEAQAVDLALRLARWFVASGGVGTDGRGRMARHLANGAALPDGMVGDTRPSDAAQPVRVGNRGGGVNVGFAFGQVPAGKLRWLADQSRLPLRITPWRMVFVQWPKARAFDEPDSDLITHPDDPRLRTYACTGAPGCAQAAGPTRELALGLAALVPQGQVLHVSGCAKGCAHPLPADLTLVVQPGGLAVIRRGRACDQPDHVLADTGHPALYQSDVHDPHL